MSQDHLKLNSIDREQWRIEVEHVIGQICAIMRVDDLADEKKNRYSRAIGKSLFKFIPDIVDHPQAAEHFLNRLMSAAKERSTNLYSTSREFQHLGR